MLHSLSLREEIALGGVLLLSLGWVVRALRRWRSVPADSWLRVSLTGRISEIELPMTWFQRVLRSQRPFVWSVRALRRLFRHAAGDMRIKGIVLEVHDLACGWATTQSLRDVVTEFRASGKPVVAWLPRGGMTREYYLATAAEKILVTPQAGVAPIGLASGQSFYKTLLGKGGVETEALSRREYKSAIEPYTRDGSSEASRQQTEALLDAIHGGVVEAVASTRKLERERVRELIDHAPYRSKEAIDAGLIDGVAYEDELAARLGSPAPKLVRAHRYVATARPWGLARRGLGRPRRGRAGVVGVVEVRGAIVHDAPAGGARAADANRVIAALRVARENPRVKAVVLYVDSPGGSALASDLIAREVERLREKKPVVAFMGDAAASGGYYVSALANEIVAQPATITGSIGVFTMRLVFEKAIEKLGIAHEVIRRGARADVLSPYRKWTDDERVALDREIDGFYRDFVDIVARGRKRSADQIEPLARGRVYAGSDALAVGLVDRLGGMDVALRRAAELANMPAPGEPFVVPTPREMPEPPEPLAKLDPILTRLGISRDSLALALSNPSERFYAFDDVRVD